MATVYSLICWGGKDGKTVTFTDAGDVVNLTNHGLKDATGIVFTDNGNTLPTGLSKNTTYYAKSTGANTFTIYTTSGLTTQVTFTGTGSGTHKAKSAYYVGLSDKSRWTQASVELIYAGLREWNTGRASASGYDTEVAEIAEAFDDIGANLTLSIPAASTVATTYVNGSRSSAYHSNVYNGGYRFVFAVSGNATTLTTSKYRTILDGFVVTVSGAGYSPNGISLGQPASEARNMQAIGRFDGQGVGVGLGAPFQSSINCLSLGWGSGLRVGQFSEGMLAANNTLVKNTTGMDATNTTFIYGFYYNNLSVGNTTNWKAATSGFGGADRNAGLSGEAWIAGSGTRVTVATTDFTDFANNDYRAAAVTSPQVENGVAYYGADQYDYDLDDAVRPSYPGSNYGIAVTAGSFVAGLSYTIAAVGTTDFTLIGASTNTVGVVFKATGVGSGSGAATLNAIYDIGALEYDLGYGAWPQTQPVSVSGLATGTRVKIAKQSDGTELFNDVESSGSISYTEDLIASTPVYVYLRKSSAAPFYHPTRLSATIDPETGLSLSASGLQIEDIAASTYTAGVATDWSINTSTGAITHTTGSTRYTVRDLYSYHQDYMDDSTRVHLGPFMYGITPTQFELINSGDISDADIEDLKGGSIEFPDGDLWSNVYNVGTLTGTPTIYIYQGTSKITIHWPAGDIDILIKVKNAGSLISSGLVTGYARKWGYTYDHYESDLSAGGRNVMPLSTIADINITETTTTVDAWSDVTFTFGSTSKDFGDGDGPQTYYLVINCNNRPISEVYQRAQYVCREGAADTLNGAAAETYQKANAAYTANKSAPFGTYAGGTWTLAQGIWLDNVASADSVNYILTDHAGNTHQNVITPGAASATVLAGSRVQLYNVDTATQIDNVINADTSYSYAITTEASGGETLRLRVTKLGYEPVEVFGVYNATAGVQFLVSQVSDAIYTAWGIDGSTVTEFSLDVTGNIEIDANDVDGATTKTRLGAWYNYALTSADGIRYAFGAITALAVNAIRINVDVVDLTIENTNATTALRFTDTDVRLYRSDGTTIIAATSYSIHNDYSGVPDVVETGVSGLTGSESAQLMGLPSAAANASALLTAAQTTPIYADTRKMNGATVTGAGTSGDKWRGV